MPTRDHIQAEIHRLKGAGQDDIRHKYLGKLNKRTGRDTVIYFSSYGIQRPFPVPATALSVSQDDIQGFMASLHKLKGDDLDLILHSPGGSLEAADQIVQYLRAKYKNIRAIVPQNAMSAATMIACACDEIVLGKHSAIGPIDPQMLFG
jgi:ClpP class serine protease